MDAIEAMREQPRSPSCRALRNTTRTRTGSSRRGAESGPAGNSVPVGRTGPAQQPFRSPSYVVQGTADEYGTERHGSRTTVDASCCERMPDANLLPGVGHLIHHQAAGPRGRARGGGDGLSDPRLTDGAPTTRMGPAAFTETRL